MALNVLIPKLGLTMETGLIEEWLVEAGTEIKSGEPLMRLATDKVDVDVEAEGSGIFHPAVPAGTELPPGSLVGWLLEPGEAVPAAAAVPATLQEPEVNAPVAASPSVVAAVAAPTATGEHGRFFSSPNARRVAKERSVEITSLRGSGPGGRVITADVLEAPVAAAPKAPAPGSPLVRRDAAAAGIDLQGVSGSGPGGKVLRSDLVAAPSLTAGTAAPAAADQVVPLTGMRGVIAKRMHASLQEMAQLTLGTDATMDAVVALRADLKEQWSAAGLTVPTITDIIVRASALALRDHPRMNAGIIGNEIHVFGEINVGVAVALGDGLIVPVAKRADQLALSGLAAETRRLVDGARTGGLALTDLEGGTFTVSTLGGFGIDFFTPVISPGQVGILGVGRLRDSVRWEGETPVRTQVLTLSLTFDHRAVDGAPAADYLRSVVALLENPLRLLA